MFNKLFMLMMVSAVVIAPATNAQTQQQKIEEIKVMLEANPEVVDTLHQSLSAYIEQQREFGKLLESSQSYIKDPSHSFIGSETPELTVINVTDYSCPFCKKLEGELAKLVEAFPQIKVVNLYVPLKEGNTDLNSAAYALNVWQNDREKYAQVHDLLVKKPGSHNPMSLTMVAKKTGTESWLNSNEQIHQHLEKNYQLFEGFGLRGTPALIIDSEVIPGYVPFEQLEKVIEEKLAK